MREFLSPPDFPEISGIRWNLGEFGEIREISGKLRGIQWNSVGFCMALNMNSVGIPGDFGARPGFRENSGFGVVSGDLGPQKAFAQMTNLDAEILQNRENRQQDRMGGRAENHCENILKTFFYVTETAGI